MGQLKVLCFDAEQSIYNDEVGEPADSHSKTDSFGSMFVLKHLRRQGPNQWAVSQAEDDGICDWRRSVEGLSRPLLR